MDCHTQARDGVPEVLSGTTTEESQSDRSSTLDRSAGSTPLNIIESPGNILHDFSGSKDVLFDFSNLERDYLNLDMIEFNAPGLDSRNNSDLFHLSASATKTLAPAISEFPNHSDNSQMEYVPNSFPLMMPTFNTRSFIQRPAMRSGAQNTATLITHILTSYPAMMRDHGSLPPFIHPHLLGNVQDSDSRSFESLTTCMSLMQMFGSDVYGSRKLAWRNVRLECERMSEDVSESHFSYDGTLVMLIPVLVGWI
jgi:hypothetical protein